MADITLFELHLDDATFSNSAPFFGGKEADGGTESGSDGEATAEADGGMSGKLLVLLALGAIVAFAWLVSRSEVGEEIAIDEEVELPS